MSRYWPCDSADGLIALWSGRGLSISLAADYGWLVRAVVDDKTGSVLACVDESNDEIELMEVTGGFRWSTHPSIHSALEQLLRDLR